MPNTTNCPAVRPAGFCFSIVSFCWSVANPLNQIECAQPVHADFSHAVVSQLSISARPQRRGLRRLSDTWAITYKPTGSFEYVICRRLCTANA
jgi:hypothetical protein